MPTIKVRCPECDARVVREVRAFRKETEVTLTCPKCDLEFTEVVGPAAAKSKTPLIAGGALLGGALVAVAVVLATSGGKDKGKEAAKADPPAKAAPRPQPRPNPAPVAHPNPDPPDPVAVPEPSPGPQPAVPPDPPAAGGEDDVFVRAATFKPVGPLPELPPLPPTDRRPVLTLDPGGHTAFVKHAFFTPDGERVITIGDDKAVRFWSIATGESLVTVPLPAGPDVEGVPQGAALSPDGKHLAIGVFPMNRGKTGLPIYVLSTETGGYEQVVGGSREVQTALDYSPDGKRLAVGCGDGTLQVLEVATGKAAFEVRAHRDSIVGVRFNPKSPVVATVGRESVVAVWSLADRTKPVAVIDLTGKKPHTLDWASDGKTLAVGGVSGEVYLYDAAGAPIKTLPAIMERGGPMQINQMRFLPGDKQLIYGGIAYSGWVGVIDVATGDRPVTVKEHSNTVRAVACNADGSLAVTSGGEAHETIVWKTSDGTVVRKFAGASRGLWAVGWGRDGKSVAWGSVNGAGPDGLAALDSSLRLDELTAGPRPDPAAYQRHVRGDGGLSVTVNDFFSFTVTENGKPLYRHTAAPAGNRIYSVSIVPGKGIVVGASFAMYLIDARTGAELRRFHGDNGLTTAVAPAPDGRHFVTGSSDQIVRVWSPDQSEPLLSVFGVNREWIAWTPRGYYACSPHGERLIGWQLNNGIDRAPSVHPAVRFRASLYQPDVLKYLVPAGNLQLALALAAKFDRQAVAATGLADVLPPAVALAAPAAATDKVVVKATATGTAKNPITAVRLLVDGRPYEGAAGLKRFDPAQVKAEATWNVTLPPGAHTLTAQAESAVSKGVSSPVAVTFQGKPQLPNLYVLAVGVSDYPGDMKLNYAASDAALLTGALRDKSRPVFGTIEVKVVTDRDATRSGILEGLDWLKGKMTAKDVGVFSFSGHGARDPRTGTFYLVPVDVTDDFARTCVSGDEFKSRLENMPGRLVAVLDACHSGAASGTPEPKGGRPQKPKPAAGRADNLVRDLVTDDYGVVVMCSSLGMEYSLESPATKAGFFTLGLVEGLSGKADFNKDGVVYMHELDTYATLRVAQLSSGRQNPTTGRPPTIRSFPISKP
ncbi:wd40 repeat-containing protein : WD40 repeat-containing protein OS=Singulisphaera acidiphila (strain ATCC BAA-1392 / DSM 18658 / VKM B-2454 / MOB10) GN=Sinac_0055 PE=4 SV=1: WD40: WD40: WD40: WD40: Peptidase_C14 [Gemmataceae bacterium]|nr:wd40 repeat-containing protein : WD40 repeat-containing protein OS=Singulisphaera acidiphila (strain ATCC BAA-1392 / DSM 18658 / VKM B-2454 / MOB10) GN=Sinac_0055 PE=4 SV=1: WD40: WD40: WD40: WD40: Peptidase_C14 [Gemmataceae bacterium]VTU02086.1 wd40 repeat-containing protein : WD40 repeat-containing protein OS=Singulisphaera acidiphila (strain ATCC BAA-1392 / DSM 18658 / VKM B-2454 / MOB10) GN=Sinac_0055 PE=4 SV=1: WD40: WD40: WD40: WD40: Peptidase_C14 [Gemmataceae bacterium]